MRVEKWYLDCVNPAGAGMIGYAARVSIGPLALRLSETLQWSATAAPVENRTVFGGALPKDCPEVVAWSNPSLAARGRWRPVAAAMRPLVLHEDATGRIEWTCRCPAAMVRTRIGPNLYEGPGYAERLVLTMRPDRLPLRELRWGRFIAETQSCIWIRWRGPVERQWFFHNGREVAAGPADPPVMDWPGHRLVLAPGRVLRSGRIADTAFGQAGWLRRLLPAAVRDLEETKWCCAGVLTDATGRTHAGWAIHEVATFP